MLRSNSSPSVFFTLCRTVLLLFVATTSWSVYAESEWPSSLIERTDRYAFYSNFWINLHHFLYAQAQRADGQPIDGGRNLSRDEFAQIDGAIDWYRDNLADRDLLMDRRMYAVKRALIGYEAHVLPEAGEVAGEHLAQLETAASIYRKYYWPRHDRQNREIVAWHLDRIRSMENQVLDRISELAQQPWPDEEIRVDLTWDANWAGAYCTTQPIHAVLTSRPGGPDNSWPPGGWLELLFHEPSHAIIDPDQSTVGKTIFQVAEQQGHLDPGQLWHAVLFLFSGTAVQEALHQAGIDHQLLMVSEGIFSRYQPEVNEGFLKYIAGDDDLLSATQATLTRISATNTQR